MAARFRGDSPVATIPEGQYDRRAILDDPRDLFP
jgi:hypothetical protein